VRDVFTLTQALFRISIMSCTSHGDKIYQPKPTVKYYTYVDIVLVFLLTSVISKYTLGVRNNGTGYSQMQRVQ
jgi:hypothetical protein